MSKFEIYNNGTQFYWRLKSANGQTIATGGEGFTTKASAQNGVAAVQRDAPSASVEDLTT